ncbi:adenylate kinase 7a isoform X2 [Trichomycterus rosablanca]|uniref:adenylate kinase 7a isoform X2 n=1 Tax=Trichomycterus rosablanca TaxID=2290929 RepID=UPI002F35CFEF
MESQQVEFQRSKRIFINNIDSYSSKNIAKYLSTCAVGESLEETEADEDEEAPKEEDVSPQERFQIVGTVSNKDENSKSFALEQYSALDRHELLQRIMECDVIVYNISEKAEVIDEATWAISALHGEIEHFTSPKMFILVSTLMTWAMTKPPDPDEPEIPVTEDDFTRKRPHPNFKEHASAEKLVLKLGKTKKSKLSTYVVAAGLQYGMGEGILHFFFKASWLGELSSIPVLDPGSNIIPVIHVHDLASVVQNIIDHKSKIHYFIAVDDSHHTLENIVQAIADELGPGKVEKVLKDNVYLNKELMRAELDCSSINLCIEPTMLKDKLNIRWVCESGLIDNISHVVKEFQHARQLQPIKICLMGPPAVGKSSVAALLCKHYKLHHIGVKEAVEEKINYLEAVLDGDDETDEVLQGTKEQLVSLKDIVSQNADQPADQNVLRIIREKLLSKPCRNQGFVLDGYPSTLEQAKELFYDEDTELFDSKIQPYNKNLIPEYVFSLDVTDEYLIERVQNLPENVAVEMHYTQDEFMQRLSQFREINTEDESVLNYFDELEIHPEHIEINNVNDSENEAVIEKIIEIVGKAMNYGPTPEECEELERKQAVQRQQQLIYEADENVCRETEENARITALLEEWECNGGEKSGA